MLITEIIIIDNQEYIHNYSDNGHYIIRNDGVEFTDAIDLINSGYTYIESDKLIPEQEDYNEIPQQEED